jgi:hypothetical protein
VDPGGAGNAGGHSVLKAESLGSAEGSAIVDQSLEPWGLSTLMRGMMSYITPLHGSPAVSWTTNIHPSILWHFVKYNLYQIRCDYPAYQTLINLYLKDCMKSQRKLSLEWIK